MMVQYINSNSSTNAYLIGNLNRKIEKWVCSTLFKLATIPMFPNLSQKTGLSPGSLTKAQTRLGHASAPLTSQMGLLVPGTFGQSDVPGSSISPHLSGSAFQLIGSSSASAAATAATLTAGGISLPLQNTDSILLGRLLHEKETMVRWCMFQILKIFLLEFSVVIFYMRI